MNYNFQATKRRCYSHRLSRRERGHRWLLDVVKFRDRYTASKLKKTTLTVMVVLLIRWR